MSYPNEINNAIERHYSLLRNENVRTENERRSHVYENVAGYRELTAEQAQLSAQAARAALGGSAYGADAQARLSSQLQDLARRKKELLIQNGLSGDYLEPYVHCPICKDTGYTDGKPCSCSRQLLISLLYRYSNLSALDQQNFDKLDMSLYPEHIKAKNGWSVRDIMEQIVDYCKSYAEDFTADNASSLLLTGNTGTGKTFLASCIARRVMDRGYSVLYLSATDAFTILRQDTWAFKDEEDDDTFENEKAKMMTDCDLMIIDDLGTEMTNSFTVASLFSLLNERFLRKRPVIISTNLSLEELQARYTDRIFSRLTGEFTFCRLSGPDIRIALKFADNP